MKNVLVLCCLACWCVVAAQKKKPILTIAGVGDVMLGTTYPHRHLPPGDGQKLLLPAAAYLRGAHLVFGNYEGTLFDGEGVPKQCADTMRCFAFKTPERYAAYLQQAGFSVMSVANNHSGDFGPEGRERTIAVLQQAGIATCGTDKKPYVIIEKKGVRYGIAAFAPNVGTPNINNHQMARRIVAHLDSICDIVLVSFHGGAEGVNQQHVPRQKEYFLGEDRGDVYRFARVVIDAGADVVFGHGPHVPRAVDLYKGRFIAYSLGNFATYGRFNLKGAAGMAPIVKIVVNKKGQFIKGTIISMKQSGQGGPRPDKKQTAVFAIRALTAKDFPESPLVVLANGQIRRKAAKNKNAPLL